MCSGSLAFTAPQFEQVLINLCVNARDAMPDGGTLTIQARNVPERETQKFEHREFAHGEYVLIEVRDTGCGMSEEVKQRVDALWRELGL